MDDYLSTIFYGVGQPASFSSIDKLYFQAKADGRNYTKPDIVSWLEEQELYGLFKPAPEKTERPEVIVPYYGYQFEADTMWMKKWAKMNKGYGFILLIIDVFSRYVWCFPMKTVKASDSFPILKRFFEDHNCSILRTDNGVEFLNGLVRGLLEKKGIKHVKTRNIQKANIAERAIKTIKHKIIKNNYFEQSYYWLDDLEKVVHSYNSTRHRSIRMSPNEAVKADPSVVWRNQYLPQPTAKLSDTKPKKKREHIRPVFRYDIGQTVRISRLYHWFKRAYDEQFTHELFIIIDRHLQQGIPKYTLKSWANELIDGDFYQDELQKVEVDQNTVYKIDRVIKKERRERRNFYLVSWLGWPKQYNSYINEDDFRDLKARKG